MSASDDKNFRDSFAGVILTSQLTIYLLGGAATTLSGLGIWTILNPFRPPDREQVTDNFITLADRLEDWVLALPSFDGRYLLFYAVQDDDGEWFVSIVAEEPNGRQPRRRQWRGRPAPFGYINEVIEPMLAEDGVYFIETANLPLNSALRRAYMRDDPPVTVAYLYCVDISGDRRSVYYLAATSSEPPDRRDIDRYENFANRVRTFFAGIW